MTLPDDVELFSRELTVCIDFASLPTCVGITPISSLEDEFGIRIDWLPLSGGTKRLSERQPAPGTLDPLARYKARRQAARRKWARRELERNCERLGIRVEAGERQFDSTILNLGLLFLNAHRISASDYVKRAFRAAFVDGLAVDQVEVVIALLEQERWKNDGWKNDGWKSDGLMNDGLEVREFGSFATGDESRRALEELQNRLLAGGVLNSPTFVCEEEIFEGRQHLPMVRWMLAGHKGLPPV